MAVLRLSDADRSRRDKLVGMHGSSFDGERLNTLGLLQHTADNYKVPIHELLLAYETTQRAEQAVREAQHARPAEPDSMTPKLPPHWQELFATAEQLNRYSFFLTGWEANFVADLLTRETRYGSPKQAIQVTRVLEEAATFASRTTNTDADLEDVE